MKLQRRSVHRIVVAAGLMLAGLGVAQCLAQTPRRLSSRDALGSVRVLNDAWNLENNAMLRSSAYARKADEEGYAPVASLFRAVAQSQRVHARNLASALKSLGWQPLPAAQVFAVGSTEENLRAEIALHSRYKQETFPRYVSVLKRENFSAALRSMSEASRSEASVVNYLREAAESLNSSRKVERVTYYVCEKCGYMTRSANFHVCKVCYHFREKHAAVS